MFLSSVVYAQFRPEKKSKTTEFQYYPLKTGSPMNGLKIRYFFSEKKALTVRIGFEGGTFFRLIR